LQLLRAGSRARGLASGIGVEEIHGEENQEETRTDSARRRQMVREARFYACI
jgi:hypothetical protein